jgi:xanthosine utilization system XapX-like protein
MVSSVLTGVLAGAAGTAALNIVTYLDMAGRGRPASSMPAQAAEKMSHAVGISLGEGDTKQNRVQGLGALLGYATGLTVGAGYGLARSRVRVPAPLAAVGLGLAAMAVSGASLPALGLTDPRSWSASSWAMDVVPHLAYGVVTAITFEVASR